MLSEGEADGGAVGGEVVGVVGVGNEGVEDGLADGTVVVG